MKRISAIYIISLLIIGTALGQEWKPQKWPVLKHYDSEHLYNIALPIGGIGTGTVSLGGRGELRDWEIMNRPGKGYSTGIIGNNAPFFSVYVKSPGNKPITKALIGPVDRSEYLHYEGRSVNNHGLPRFEKASFDAAYPFGQVNLSDNNVPIKIKIKSFNPFIPGDSDASGIPIAIISYEVTNITKNTLQVSVCGTLRNFIGQDGSETKRNWKGDIIPLGAKNNINVYRKDDMLMGIFMYSDSVDKNSSAWGTIALTTNSKEGVTFRTSSTSNKWENALLDFWDDFSEDGKLSEKNTIIDNDPMASLAVLKEIAPNSTQTFSFFITWDFPNRDAWVPYSLKHGKDIVGNYYSNDYKDAWDVASKTISRLKELESKTLLFVNSFLSSSYPLPVKEAALFNLSVLRSQTVFRIADGHMFGWEGIFDEVGSCFGSCTHVWNYEQATAFLFGDLSRSMRDVEFNYATFDNGKMNFRVLLPLSKALEWKKSPAADGQMGTIMKFYRDWQLSGDNEFLKANYSKVKKVISFAWEKGSWDANEDGVMEGSQHNTMDVDYYGPNPQMGFWYLGALKAMEEMALFMSDKQFADKCVSLFKRGSKWMDDNLFNGEYYEQKITDPLTHEYIDFENNPNAKVPDYQLGKGCLVDQLVGQYMAHICGLGYLAKPEHIKATLQSIMKYNYLSDFSNHFNNMRSFVMGNESGLLMASWPKGRLKVPFPYFNESMTGFEYTAAVGMLYENQTDDGLKCIKSVRDRFDGYKRNPFSEPECGHHYARSMASWAAILAISGFNYSGVSNTFTATSNSGNYFWSNGSSWGTFDIIKHGTKSIISINVLSGQLSINHVILKNKRDLNFEKTQLIKAGQSAQYSF